jgi:hypothetical protein
MEGAAAIGFQSALERLQVLHEVLGFGTPFAQRPLSQKRLIEVPLSGECWKWAVLFQEVGFSF